jgi:hypothetical protein
MLFSSGWRNTSSTWRRNSGSSSRKRIPWCASDTSPGRGTSPLDQPHSGDGAMGVRHGRVVTTAARAPVRPATRWRRVVSRASAKVIAGRLVVSPPQHRVPCPWWAEHEGIRDPMPAGACAWLPYAVASAPDAAQPDRDCWGFRSSAEPRGLGRASRPSNACGICEVLSMGAHELSSNA